MSFLSEVIPINQMRNTLNNTRVFTFNYDLSGKTDFRVSLSGFQTYTSSGSGITTNTVNGNVLPLSLPLANNLVTGTNMIIAPISSIGVVSGSINFQYQVNLNRSINLVTLTITTTAVSGSLAWDGYMCFAINGRP